MGKTKKNRKGESDKDSKEVLVEIVKALRLKDMKGTKGSWDTFLASVDKNDKGSHNPSLRSLNDLQSFLATMKDNNLQLVQLLRPWTMRNMEMKRLDREDPLPVTLEEKLVQTTQAHARYRRDYFFDSYNEGWIHTHRGKSGHVNTPERLVGLDCEMVECNDGMHEVVRICVVDRDLTTLIDTFVLPSKSVLDYKSHITGIQAEDLKGVSVTQANVQKQVRGVLRPGTIIVGHGLHNDLKVLKIDHRRVIDTQYIYPIEGRSPFVTPNLRDLCKAVLGYDFREDDRPHDCLEDAKVPMRLVLHHLQRGPHRLQIPSTYGMDETLLSKLLLHKVPAAATNDDLESLFSKNFCCQIEDAKKGGKTSSTYTAKYAVFNNKADANIAFKQLQGFLGTDITGRLQKTVFLRPSSLQRRNAAKVELMVRKMGFEECDTNDSARTKLKHPGTEAVSKLSQVSESGKARNMYKQGVAGEKKMTQKIEELVREDGGTVVEELSSCSGAFGGVNEKELAALKDAKTHESVEKANGSLHYNVEMEAKKCESVKMLKRRNHDNVENVSKEHGSVEKVHGSVRINVEMEGKSRKSVKKLKRRHHDNVERMYQRSI